MRIRDALVDLGASVGIQYEFIQLFEDKSIVRIEKLLNWLYAKNTEYQEWVKQALATTEKQIDFQNECKSVSSNLAEAQKCIAMGKVKEACSLYYVAGMNYTLSEFSHAYLSDQRLESYVKCLKQIDAYKIIEAVLLSLKNPKTSGYVEADKKGRLAPTRWTMETDVDPPRFPDRKTAKVVLKNIRNAEALKPKFCPVCGSKLDEDTLTCPVHKVKFDVK